MGCTSSKATELRVELDQTKARVKELEPNPNLAKLQAELQNLPPAAATKLVAQFHEISQTATKHHKVAAASPRTSTSEKKLSISKANEMLEQYQAAYMASSSSTADSLFEATRPQLSAPIGSTATEPVQLKEESSIVPLTLPKKAPSPKRAPQPSPRPSPKPSPQQPLRRRRSTGKSAPTAAPEEMAPTPIAVEPVPVAETIAKPESEMSLEQELVARTRSLAAKLGLEEAALAKAESIEYAGAALDEEDVANLLTILGKGGLPQLEMAGAIPVGALVSDALVELQLCELEQNPLGAVGLL